MLQSFTKRFGLIGAVNMKPRKDGRLRRVGRWIFAVVMGTFIVLGFFEGCFFADVAYPTHHEQPYPYLVPSMETLYESEGMK